MSEESFCWPNTPSWCALREGKIQFGDTNHHFEVVDCGKLVLPSGRLVACDPFADMARGGNHYFQVPPGSYPVRVTVIDVSEEGDGSHLREAYASLLLTDVPEVRRGALALLQEGDEPPVLEEGEFIGFGVDAGTACFVDDEALKTGMPPEEEWPQLFDSEDSSCWFARMDDPDHLREGLANVPLPLAKNGENLVLFHSGWGDGAYPVVGGYDAQGNLVAIHIDFLIIEGELPEV